MTCHPSLAPLGRAANELLDAWDRWDAQEDAGFDGPLYEALAAAVRELRGEAHLASFAWPY